MSRLGHLDVTDLTLLGVTGDYLGLFKSLDFNWQVLTAQGRAVSQRHQIEVPTKKELTFSVAEMITSTGGGAIRQTNLNITVFTLGATAYLGKLKNGTLKISTDAKEGSGAADEWKFPYAQGTSWEVTGEMYVDANAALVTAITTAGIAGLLTTVTVTCGGSSFACPATLTANSHKIQEGELQMFNVTIKGRGTPSAVTGNGMLLSIATGTAVGAYNAACGIYTAAGSWLITGTEISFGDESIITATHQFAGQGAPTMS